MLRFTDVPSASFLWWLDLLATILSFFGSLWMIFQCLKAPSPKSFSLKLIATIGLANFLYSASNLLSNFERDSENHVADEDQDSIDLCSWEASLRQISYVLSIFFSTCIAIASYFAACPGRKFNKTLFFYFSLLFGLVISFAYIYLIPGQFEDSIVIAQGPFYCWFTYSSTPSISIFTKTLLTTTFQGLPVFIGLILTLVAYLLIEKQVKNLSRGVLEKSDLKVFWYPMILFIVFMPTAIDCILRVFIPERSVLINMLYLVLPHSIGFSHAVLYGVQTEFGKRKYEDFRSTSNEESNSISLSFARS